MEKNEAENFKEDGLGKLEKRLYKESETFKRRYERESLAPSGKEIKDYWVSPDDQNKNVMRNILSTTGKDSAPRRKFLALYIFLILAISSIAVYFLWEEFGHLNVVSSKKIDMVVDGPAAVKAGERGKWYISIVNNNEVGLELADLIIDYPPETVSTENVKLSRDRVAVGKIAPGETIKREVNVYLMGREGEYKDFTYTLEYRPAGSNAILVKTAGETVQISQSPVGVFLNLPEETESGQEIVLNIEYVSNAEIVLRDVVFKMEYPPGFHFTEASPAPFRDSNIWAIGDLSPNEKRNLRIRGILEGQDMTEVGFRGFVGVEKNNEIFTFSTAGDSVLLRRPFLDFDFGLKGRESDFLFSGQNVSVEIPWKNNLPVEIRNVTLRVKILGVAVDQYSINASRGFYRSYDKAMVWNSSGVAEFKNLPPGENGSVSLGFKILSSLPVNKITDKNFAVTLEGEIEGFKVGEDGQMVSVKSSQTKEIKIASNFQVVSKALHYSGAFENSGPMPPKVGEETTYTIVWALSNFYNDISSVKVKAFLPTYIRWMGEVNPSSEDVYYDQTTGEVLWRVQTLESGTGILRPTREVSFRVALTPALNQFNTSPDLLLDTRAEGTDTFIGDMLKGSSRSLSIRLSEDPGFDSSKGKVVQ